MSEITTDEIQWRLIRTEDWGGGPEHTYEATNVQHTACAGDVYLTELHDAMGGILSARIHCATCGEDLTN